MSWSRQRARQQESHHHHEKAPGRKTRVQIPPLQFLWLYTHALFFTFSFSIHSPGYFLYIQHAAAVLVETIKDTWLLLLLLLPRLSLSTCGFHQRVFGGN